MAKLCPEGKAAAKRKFKVYPSAYANAYASKICAGKIKDPSGVKRKDFRGPKPAAMGAMINKPKKAALGAIIGLGAAALGKKMFGKKTKQATPTKGIGPITTMYEKQAKKRKEFMGMSKGGGADFDTSGSRIKPYGKTAKVKIEKLKPKASYNKPFYMKHSNEGEFIKKPQPPLRNKKNIRRSLSPKEIEYQKKKKAYDTLTGNEDKRPRPKRFKKGKAIMIVIGIGKKKPSKKMMGGVAKTAGAQSAMGRLEKSGMTMSRGGMADYYKDLM